MGDTETVRVKLLGTFSISRGRLSVSEPLVSRESQSWKMLKYLCANCGRTIETEELKRELIFAGNESNISNTLRVRLRRARIAVHGKTTATPYLIRQSTGTGSV